MTTQWAIQFRSTYGFRSDEEFVSAAEADPFLSREYGLALTENEVAEMHRRDAVATNIVLLSAYLANEERFGGLFLDQSAGAVVDVAYAGDPDSIQSKVNSLAPAGANVRIRHVQYTLAELSALQDRVTQDADMWRTSGVIIASVGVDIRGNRTRVAVADLTGEAAGKLADEYGPRAEIVGGEAPAPASCVSRSDCASPLKGGLWIVSGGFACTSGFLGRPGTAPTPLYMMTAGHCLQDSGLAPNWTHHGVVIGHGAFEQYYNGTNADIGAINATESGAKNQVYANSPTDIRSITGHLLISQQPVGATICRSGASSGYRCGQVAQTNVDTWVGPYLVHHMWVTDYPSSGGDSGGSMINGFNAAGIFSALTSTNSYYSTIDWIVTEHNVRPCYSASCG